MLPSPATASSVNCLCDRSTPVNYTLRADYRKSHTCLALLRQQAAERRFHYGVAATSLASSLNVGLFSVGSW